MQVWGGGVRASSTLVQALHWQVVWREGENVRVRENQGWRGPVHHPSVPAFPLPCSYIKHSLLLTLCLMNVHTYLCKKQHRKCKRTMTMERSMNPDSHQYNARLLIDTILRAFFALFFLRAKGDICFTSFLNWALCKDTLRCFKSSSKQIYFDIYMF